MVFRPQAARADCETEPQYEMGKTYLCGADSIEVNAPLALRFLRKAADQGHPEAAFLSGALLCDPVQAIQGKFEDAYLNCALLGGHSEVSRRRTAAQCSQGRKYLLDAVRAGHAKATYVLGLSHLSKLDGNVEKGLRLVQLAADQGVTEAQISLGIVFRGLARPREAFRYSEMAAKQGDRIGQCLLGDHYRRGLGVDASLEEALEWFLLSASQGLPDAQCAAGRFYTEGLGVSRDYEKARKFFELAAAQGSPEAQAQLAQLYAQGRGVGKDHQKAVELLELASNAGHENALFLLAQCHERGLGASKDLGKALQSYKLAAELGNVKAQNAVARFYEQGLGGKRNIHRAAQFYRKAASSGSREALRRLAWILYDGLLGAANPTAACRYWQQAAALGCRESQFKLALCYERGEGVEKNPERSDQLLKECADWLRL